MIPALALVIGLALSEFQVPAPAAPAAPAPVVDPAATTFATPAGLVLVLIKADKVTDYDTALQALQEALSKDADPKRRQIASGWRVFKAAEPDAKGNAVYVHALLPAVADVDYRVSLWLDEVLKNAPPEWATRYRETFAAPPTKLSLTEFANMAVAPVKKD